MLIGLFGHCKKLLRVPTGGKTTCRVRVVWFWGQDFVKIGLVRFLCKAAADAASIAVIESSWVVLASAAWAAAVNAERRWVLVGEMFNVSCCHFGSRWMTGGSNSMIGRGLVHRVLRLEGGFLNARPGG